MLKIAAIVLTFALASVVNADEHCSFEKRMQDDFATAGISQINIDARAGVLTVDGDAETHALTVNARACASQSDLLEAVEWGVERRGDKLYLKVVIPQGNYHDWALLDLRLRVPAGMDMDISDTSGAIEITRVGALRIKDSSGSITVAGTSGSVIVDDNSGALELRDIGGDLDVDDSSGSIDIRAVRGSVRIADGSGGIDVRDIEGNVVIERDGSGGIRVSDVAGDFVVHRDGSGGITHRRVAGAVRLPGSDY